jgi:hypothetical protein
MNGLQVRASHRENVGGAIDEGSGERLAAEPANVDAFLFADVDGMQARRLPAHGMHAGGSDLDLLSITEQPAEKAFRHGTAADIARADKKDAFHDEKPAPCRSGKLRPNQLKSTRRGGRKTKERRFEIADCIGIAEPLCRRNERCEPAERFDGE